jgi:hypothetical protein
VSQAQVANDKGRYHSQSGGREEEMARVSASLESLAPDLSACSSFWGIGYGYANHGR